MSDARNTTTFAAYSINTTDSESPPAWLDLCTSATPGAQDGGRCRWLVTTEQASALEAALEADAAVESYRETDATCRMLAPLMREVGLVDVDNARRHESTMIGRARDLRHGEQATESLRAMGLDVDLRSTGDDQTWLFVSRREARQ